MRTNIDKLAHGTPQHWSEAISFTWPNKPGRVVFEHYGAMDPMTVTCLLSKAESASMDVADGVGMRKRLMNVLVEGLENTHRHTPASHHDSVFALLMDHDDGYRLVLGNALPVASAALLMHRVGMLNEMEEVDLKEHFLKLLANDGRTERGGAGLGLITMARKSARPMLFHQIPKDEHTAYFAMELAVLRS